MGFFDIIGDIWNWITEKFSEGFEEFIDLFTGMFSNLNEFSIPGLVAGSIITIILFFARDMVLTPFTKLMPPAQGILTSIICYAAVFTVGYLMMKAAFEK